MADAQTLLELGVEETTTFTYEELDSMRVRHTLEAFQTSSPDDRAVRSFDVKKCIARYKKSLPEDTYYSWSTHEWIDSSKALSTQEAHFWLAAYTLTSRLGETKKTGSDTAEVLAAGTYGGEVSRKDAVADLVNYLTVANTSWCDFAHLGEVLATLFSPATAMEILLEDLDLHSTFVKGCMNTIRFTHTDAERAALTPLTAKAISKYDHTKDRHAMEIVLELVVMTRDASRYEQLLDDYPKIGKDFYYGIPNHLEALLTTLEPAAQLERFKTLRRFMSTNHCNRLFARHGWDAFDTLIDWVLAKKGGDNALVMLDEFDSPRTVKVYAQLSRKGDFRALCEDKLYAPTPNLIAGLMQSMGSRGTARDVAVDMLRHYMTTDQKDLIESLHPLMDEKAQTAITRHILEHEARSAPTLTGRARPKWLDRTVPTNMSATFPPERLPPLFTADGEHQLSGDDVLAVVEVMSHTLKTSVHADAEKVLEFVDRADLKALSWVVYERWLTRTHKSKGMLWCVYQLAHFAGDSELIELSKELKTWPSENKWRMAQDCLEVYRTSGSDAALMTLHDIAHRVKYKSVKSAAQKLVDEIATSRGLTEEQLADRIVPDCGLDADGRRTFDYGPRSFTLVFNEEFKPVFRDNARDKIVKSLPKPGKKDDEEQAEAARAEFKEMKKQIKQVVATQQPRLEQGMIAGRRWAADEFTLLLAHHPLMRNFAVRLLWAAYNTKGKLDFCFRVDEEGALLDPEDEPIEIPEHRKVGIPHRLEIDDDTLSVWGQVFGDYEIVPPFPQLNRPTYAPEESELTKKSMVIEHEGTIAPGAVRGFIDKEGWQRGYAEDAGVIYTASRTFEAAKVSAELNFSPGIYAGGASWDEPQTIESVQFFKGTKTGYGAKAIELSKVPPAIYSEVRYAIAKLVEH